MPPTAEEQAELDALKENSITDTTPPTETVKKPGRTPGAPGKTETLIVNGRLVEVKSPKAAK